MTNIDREALLNALHEAIDGDMLIDGEGEAIGLSEAGAADVTRWAADALTEHLADAVKAAESEGFKRGAAAVREHVQRARDICLHHATGKCFSIDDEHVCVEAEQDAFYDAADWITAALHRAALAATEDQP